MGNAKWTVTDGRTITVATGDGYHMQYGRNGAVRYFIDDKWYPDDPYWDVPVNPVDVEKPVYETISREMIHDTYGRGEPLESFVANIQRIAAKAKKGCSVFVKYDEERDYEGCQFYYLQVGYERPPNAKERKERIALNKRVAERNAYRAEKAVEAERELFGRLKAKYSPDTHPKGGDA